MRDIAAPNCVAGTTPDLTVKHGATEAGATITGFIRMEVGEGIEKKEENVTEDVAKMQG